MTEPPPNPQPLDYQRPLPPGHEWLGRPDPNPAMATLLLVPGLICWIAITPFGENFRWLGEGILLVWLVAIVAALSSVYLYLFRRVTRPWYVVINLIVNISGLLFTIFIAMVALGG